MNAAPVAPTLAFRSVDRQLAAVLAGDWLTRARVPGVQSVEKELQSSGSGSVAALGFDTADMGRWDSALLAFLLRCQALCEQHHIEFQTASLPADVAKLIRLAQAVPENKDAVRKTVHAPFLERLGISGIAGWSGGAEMLKFLGENVQAFGKLLRGRAQFRWSDTLLVIQQCGPEALGIVALINFLIGLILAFVGATELARFGAAVYTADLVAVASVREMGCIMTGIIICGRTGAAFAAQLGTMKVNQEIEAFETFGISSVEFLVLPRMLALILMMPLLCVFADVIAIAGGFVVSTFMLNVSPTFYLGRTTETITLASFLLGISKGAFFGVLIAMTGCLRGIQCGTNAAAVGQATTSAVVTGITAIIASDGVFAVICNVLNI
jgi:phospholipid/cholesterol/gamma-HCH transport system permease protein